MGLQQEKTTILFTLFHKGERYPVQTFPNQYYSLMTLISDQLAIPGFGLCCGMGSCGTCVVQIANKYSGPKQQVLSCGTLVNDDLANTQIIIPDVIY